MGGRPGYNLLLDRLKPVGESSDREKRNINVTEVDPQLQDHAVGLEMEIVELARQADEAAHDGWPDREAELRSQLEKLYSELASVAERLTDESSATAAAPQVDAPPAGVNISSLAEKFRGGN